MSAKSTLDRVKQKSNDSTLFYCAHKIEKKIKRNNWRILTTYKLISDFQERLKTIFDLLMKFCDELIF